MNWKAGRQSCVHTSIGPLLAFALALAAGRASGAEPPLRIRILYDNVSTREDCRADWGFACLVEGTEKTILFDAGTRGEILLANADRLGVDLSGVEMIIISHNHQDHNGGLFSVLERAGNIPVYLPFSSPADLVARVRSAGGRPERRLEPSRLCRDAFLTGELGDQIKEQALAIERPDGLVVVTGCSHPGIVQILERARETGKRSPVAVLGGFHLLQHSEAAVEQIIRRFRDIGLRRVGAGHCTGERAMRQFRAAYGGDFIEMGAGREIRFGGAAIRSAAP